MADRDKPPPPDPRRWSTNKRVAAKKEATMGTAVKTASGAKKVRPGDAPATSANVVAATLTADEEVYRRRVARMVAAADTNEKRKEALADEVRRELATGVIRTIRPLYYLKQFSHMKRT